MTLTVHGQLSTHAHVRRNFQKAVSSTTSMAKNIAPPCLGRFQVYESAAWGLVSGDCFFLKVFACVLLLRPLLLHQVWHAES